MPRIPLRQERPRFERPRGILSALLPDPVRQRHPDDLPVRKTSSIAGLRPFALLALLATGGVAADAPPWRVAPGDLRVVCLLTVGGTLEASPTSIPGPLALLPARPAVCWGRLSVDLRTLDTGIGLRNDHLRNTYLEVGKGEGYETAALSDLRR